MRDVGGGMRRAASGAVRTIVVGILAALSITACNVGDDPADDARAGEGLGTDSGELGSTAARVCADGATTSGVDVSYYNGTIDWAKAHASGVQFAFIRV